MPSGRGPINPRGLDFYERLVDALLENGIEPMATLFHWDLPAALDDRGGWLNPDIAQWFADYASVVFTKLDDRIKLWATLNEPWVVTDGGYLHGALAPGHRNRFEAPIATHHLLRAHGAAVAAYRAHGKHDIGIVVNLEPKYAASDDPADRAATERADAYMNLQYLDAVLLGRYPERLAEIFGEAWPQWPAEDLEVDFATNRFRRHQLLHPERHALRCRQMARACRGCATEAGHLYRNGLGSISPRARRHSCRRQGALWQPTRLRDREWRGLFRPARCRRMAESADPLRVDYLHRHVLAVHEALAAGVNVHGYFAWSLLDNFEWSLGYSKRFGIVHVNFDNQQRTQKDSARYYAKIIATRGRVLSNPLFAGSSL